MILTPCWNCPGLEAKSANLIMGDVFGKPAIVTDTHCIRLVNRIGLVDGIKEPKKWRWRSGRSFPRRGAISATGSCITGGTSARRGRSLTVINAAWLISVRKNGV